jgi:hypothetical protein
MEFGSEAPAFSHLVCLTKFNCPVSLNLFKTSTAQVAGRSRRRP